MANCEACGKPLVGIKMEQSQYEFILDMMGTNWQCGYTGGDTTGHDRMIALIERTAGFPLFDRFCDFICFNNFTIVEAR